VGEAKQNPNCRLPPSSMKRTFLGFLAMILCSSMVNAIAQQPVSYHTIRVDNLDIFYREAGPSGAPALLLLHGFPSSSRMYQPLLESDLSAKYHLIAPDYPGFGHSSWPDHRQFAYTFDHLAEVIQDFTDQLHLDRYTLFLQDYGGPVGFRLGLAHPEKIQAMIIQNAAASEEGLSPLWSVRRAFWQDRAAHEPALRKNFLSLEATRQRHVGTSPNPDQINPDSWWDEYYFLNQPGQADIQLDLFFDYQNNVESYATWQKWLRDHQPPLLVLWGRYDPSFAIAGTETYRSNDSRAEVHILDAGHFAADLKPNEVIALTRAFMEEQRFP
jgi:pimeloyl-ACP methyl ester carboxylesterase